MYFLSRATSPQIFFFFFNDTATTEIYTLSLHDALPIYRQPTRLLCRRRISSPGRCDFSKRYAAFRNRGASRERSEEHTSELQSRPHLVCRLLLEKKKKRRLAEANMQNTLSRI